MCACLLQAYMKKIVTYVMQSGRFIDCVFLCSTFTAKAEKLLEKFNEVKLNYSALQEKIGKITTERSVKIFKLFFFSKDPNIVHGV